MSNIVFTMWQNDRVILDLWLKYYSKHFDKIYLICHATKGKYHKYLEGLKNKYDFDYKLYPESMNSAGINAKMLSEMQFNFLKDNKWVLYCNCDEFLIPDPKRYKNLTNLMRYYKGDMIACDAYEVIQVEGEEPIDFSKPYLKQRKYWLKNKNYNKIILSKVPLNWYQGTHRLMDMDQEESIAIKDTGLYLVHLKHADLNPRGPRDLGPLRTSPETWVDKAMQEELWVEIPEGVREQL